MGDVRLSLYLDDRPATKDQLEEIDEVNVDQVIDAAWQAQLQIPVCTDDKGNWCDPGEPFAAALGRLRVEVDPGDGTFVPLIDGPIVGRHLTMSFQPGQSTLNVTIRDDSVLLNRIERGQPYQKLKPHEIAQQVFGSADRIAEKRIDTTTKPGADGTVDEYERGTDMQVLRRLARRQGMHAYVLPGPKSGKSIGVFQPLPTKPDGLPPLILLGDDRNVEQFRPHEDAEAPASVTAQTLSLMDKSVTKATVTFRDVPLLGDTPAGANGKVPAARLLPPAGDGSIDAQTAARAAAERFSYAVTADGSVATGRYGAALSPYRVVTVKGVGAADSGDYVIRRVRHRLTRSIYFQSFELIRNAKTAGGPGGLSLPSVF
jgi:hypothetical protein